MASQTIFEYGSHRMRLMEFEGGGRKIKIVQVADVDLDVPERTGDEEGQDEADATRLERIEQAIEDGGFSTDPSAMTFPASRSIFREFDLPFTNRDQIRKVIRFEAEGHLPVDIDDLVVQHHVLREARDKAHVLVAAIKKDDLLDVLDVVGEANLDPMMCDIDDFAFFHALTATGVVEEHERMVVVNAQERSTSLQFILDGELFAVRTIRLGTHGGAHDRDEAVSEREHEVERARAHDYVQRLKREIRRTLTTLPDTGQLDVVHVVGAGTRVEGLLEALGEVFDAPASPLDLLSRVDHELSDAEVEAVGPNIGVMLGMAYKLNGMVVTNTEFRREECAYTKKFDQVKVPLVCLSFLVFLAVSFGALDAFKAANKYHTEFANLVQAGSDQLRVVMTDNSEADRVWQSAAFGKLQLGAIHRKMSGMVEEVKSTLGRSDEIPRLESALPGWIEFSRVLLESEEALGRFVLHDMKVSAAEREATIKLSGQIGSNSAVQRLITALEAHPMTVKVTYPNTDAKENSVTFTDMTVEYDLSQARFASQAVSDAISEPSR